MGQAGHSSEATLTTRNQLYMGFWEPLIEQITGTYPGGTNKSVPPKARRMDLPSGKFRAVMQPHIDQLVAYDGDASQ